MLLTYEDLRRLFPNASGIDDADLQFHTVAISSDTKQQKGLYIPVEKDSTNLQEAIENGAIAAIWDKDLQVPSYTPNHFPILYTKDHVKGLIQMIEFYNDKVSGLKSKREDMTQIFIQNEVLFHENRQYGKDELKEIMNSLIEGREK
ncbi:hypothetical protein LS684_07720 [Cytobacillus spongiae]|uniref:hypothetical protein n=1 Tax=Cytobacillus spongiae TaxID=2901381 RepID=UPI001F19193C|nr:hypothetical protein [Cytobacillus spongiae]UII57315.1 hypothetical protein LS684_07720 [Cytobacillus spongiae]